MGDAQNVEEWKKFISRTTYHQYARREIKHENSAFIINIDIIVLEVTLITPYAVCENLSFIFREWWN